MTTRDFTANVISATKVVPDGNFKNSKASGVWDINEALDLIKGGNWPNAANLSPDGFSDGVFSTHVYDGTSATSLSIDNGINLSTGGLVWIKERSNNGGGNILFSTDASGNNSELLTSNSNAAAGTGYQSGNYFTLNNNGFTTTNTVGDSKVNGREYVAWSFKVKPNFFDIVHYTGTGSNRTVSHNLGSVPGMIIVKNLGGSGHWEVFHRSIGSTKSVTLNQTDSAQTSSSRWNDTDPTSSVFTVGNNGDVNSNGANYVAYLFAHHDGNGTFGANENEDIIQCGSFTTDSYKTGEVDIGFEPGLVVIRRTSGAGNWFVLDHMRGLFTGGSDGQGLYWNQTAAEATRNISHGDSSNGIKIFGGDSSANATYIYMVIRRDSMITPTAASDVFAVDSLGGEDAAPGYRGGFPVDLALYDKDQQGNLTAVSDRLRGPQQLYANLPNAEAGESGATFDFMNGFLNNGSLDATKFGYLWKRARGYFDMVAFSGTGGNRTISHNLGVAPEMIWIKCRTSAGRDWEVYHSGIGETKFLRLNTNEAEATSSARFNNTAPSSTVFSLGNNDTVNGSGDTYISYHFATVAGVSKVGSFTQSGATNVDCGFTGSTPSFILFKRTDSTGNWYLFDSARGIVAGNDKSFYLNDDSAEISNADVVDPYSGGFATTSTLTDGDYIFYAIAATS
jgi:hypothetical protein